MSTRVKEVVVWRTKVKNRPGEMARALEPLAQQDLGIVIGYNGAVIDIAPVGGRQAVAAAARAGFNPEASVALWEKMIKVGGSGTPEFLSTHPDPSSRIAAMKVEAKRLMPVYEASRKALTSPTASQ